VRRQRRLRWRRWASALALVPLAAACELGGILDVDDPDLLPPDRLTGPAGAAALRAGALGDFALALAGDGGVVEGQILVGGLLADEFVHSGTFPSRAEYDRRSVSEENVTAARAFANLQRARRGLETAAVALERTSDDPEGDPRIGELRALAGYTYLLFAEHYCSGVPFSELDGEGRIVYGAPLPTDQTLERALARFDSALATSAGDPSAERLALVGRARALVNLGRYEEAAQAAAGVPTDWSQEVAYSTHTRAQENGVHAFAVVYELWSLADGEAAVGLPFRSALDPRVPWERAPADDLGFDRVTPQYDLLKYPARDAPIVLASGEEARLIEAEAALARGEPAATLALLDEVRGRYGLGPLADPGTDAGRRDLLFRERAFTLFATGHRLGDLRRLVRAYGLDTADVFPSGPYFKGGAYGGDVDLPVPAAERNNPLFTGCLDRGP
jgi:hypothetical protein